MMWLVCTTKANMSKIRRACAISVTTCATSEEMSVISVTWSEISAIMSEIWEMSYRIIVLALATKCALSTMPCTRLGHKLCLVQTLFDVTCTQSLPCSHVYLRFVHKDLSTLPCTCLGHKACLVHTIKANMSKVRIVYVICYNVYNISKNICNRWRTVWNKKRAPCPKCLVICIAKYALSAHTSMCLTHKRVSSTFHCKHLRHIAISKFYLPCTCLGHKVHLFHSVTEMATNIRKTCAISEERYAISVLTCTISAKTSAIWEERCEIREECNISTY